MPKAVLQDCVSYSTKFSEVAKKEDKWRDRDESEVKKWADILDDINWISEDKQIPSYMFSLYDEIHGNDGTDWYHKLFVHLAAKDIGSKYLKRPGE